jgi:hypothetical protein
MLIGDTALTRDDDLIPSPELSIAHTWLGLAQYTFTNIAVRFAEGPQTHVRDTTLVTLAALSPTHVPSNADLATDP